MDKIELKRYLDCYINTETCNFRCPYCYITQRGTYSKKVFSLEHSPLAVSAALSQHRLGGISLINLCAGGETLLSSDVIPIAKALVNEGHYVMIVTNGSLTMRFKEICDTFTAEECSHLFFKFSFHYLELKRLNLLDTYFDNIKMMRNAGCAFTCELTPCDAFIPYIDDIKSVCVEKLGALCHVTIARDDTTGGIKHLSTHSWKEYQKIWEVFDSELFEFKKTIYYKKRKEFCYAGARTLFVDLASGKYRACNCGRSLGNIYEDGEIKFEAVGCCALPHCFNGHSWLVLGAMAHFTDVTYAQERDRVNQEGVHWLNEDYGKLFSLKLDDLNTEYSNLKKMYIYAKTVCYEISEKICRRLKKE